MISLFRRSGDIFFGVSVQLGVLTRPRIAAGDILPTTIPLCLSMMVYWMWDHPCYGDNKWIDTVYDMNMVVFIYAPSSVGLWGLIRMRRLLRMVCNETFRIHVCMSSIRPRPWILALVLRRTALLSIPLVLPIGVSYALHAYTYERASGSALNHFDLLLFLAFAPTFVMLGLIAWAMMSVRMLCKSGSDSVAGTGLTDSLFVFSVIMLPTIITMIVEVSSTAAKAIGFSEKFPVISASLLLGLLCGGIAFAALMGLRGSESYEILS